MIWMVGVVSVWLKCSFFYLSNHIEPFELWVDFHLFNLWIIFICRKYTANNRSKCNIKCSNTLASSWSICGWDFSKSFDLFYAIFQELENRPLCLFLSVASAFRGLHSCSACSINSMLVCVVFMWQTGLCRTWWIVTCTIYRSSDWDLRLIRICCTADKIFERRVDSDSCISFKPC